MITTATYLYFRNGLIDYLEVFCLCTGSLALCAQAHLLLLIYYYYYNIIYYFDCCCCCCLWS